MEDKSLFIIDVVKDLGIFLDGKMSSLFTTILSLAKVENCWIWNIGITNVGELSLPSSFNVTKNCTSLLSL